VHDRGAKLCKIANWCVVSADQASSSGLCEYLTVGGEQLSDNDTRERTARVSAIDRSSDDGEKRAAS